jgi:hypothetical protein
MVQGFVLALPEIVPANFSHFEPVAPEAAGDHRAELLPAGVADAVAVRAPRSSRSFGKRIVHE